MIKFKYGFINDSDKDVHLNLGMPGKRRCADILGQ
jgi:hypothetical protein